MEAALNGLENTVKQQTTKEAVSQAKEAVKALSASENVSLPYVREKCLAAFELAFDKGNDKAAHYAVEGVQALLRDQRFHSISIENPNYSLPTQVLSAMTGVAQWNCQLQCHCLTLLVEMVCSVELRVSLQEVDECLELCMRVFGCTREESARVSARAAVSQSITAYCCNRYAAGEESQNFLSVYLDVTKLLESYIAKLDQLTVSADQSVIVFDAVNALLSAQPLSVQRHAPLVNLLWEKLCPLMIRLLGVPDKNVSVAQTISAEEPLGQGQMGKFTLSPAVVANPEATRVLYQILEQLIRIMAGIPSVNSVLEALFHKAFLFPKIEQRTEAIKIIKKILSDRRRLNDIVCSCVRSRSLSLWRMMIVCMAECAHPQYEIAIEATRACGSMLQGILDFCESPGILDEEIRWKIKEMFPTLEAVNPLSKFITPKFFLKQTKPNCRLFYGFTTRSDVGQCSPRPSAEHVEKEDCIAGTDDGDDMDQTLRKLSRKFGLQSMSEEEVAAMPIAQRRKTDYDETTEKITAQKFVDSLVDHIAEWTSFKSTLELDEAILEFSSGFYNDFSAVHNEAFKSKSKIQQEFLNTDAIYITAYSTLCLAYRGEEAVSWAAFRDRVLKSGCIVYVSESWLHKVYDHAITATFGEISGALLGVVQDFDGVDCRILTDVERLQKISQGKPPVKALEERIAARWLISSAWASIVHVFSTFVGIKERHRARQKIQDGVEYSIKGMHLLVAVAVELELGDRCGWIFENLVEFSCDVDELRTLASSEEQKRVRVLSREDLLSIQLVLDNALVSIYAPECWKHVIRCSEYVLELEKFIYGALCYEKPSRFSFGKKKQPEQPEQKEEEGISAADRSVNSAIGNGELDKDSLSRVLCILIAKVDRFYSKVGHELNLRSLQEICTAITSASENRIFYSGKKAPALTPATNLLTRISEILAPLGNRPLVHQMLLWPIVCAHFVQGITLFFYVASCPDESRIGVTALSDAISSLIIAESQGLCFNQMLIAPFQAIVCSNTCSPETRQQIVSALADFVKTKSDRIGSGWKTLFGTLRAVRTSEVDDDSVHWTVLDVIGAYLRIDKYSVLSWSLPDCIPCIVHFLQSSHSKTTTSENENLPEGSIPVDDQLSEAALRLVAPTYTVILNLFKTPHIPNPNLLHRAELRADCLDEVECATTSFPLSDSLDPVQFPLADGDPSPLQLDADLEITRGDLPWKDRPPSEVASLELLLSFVEHLAGTLVTAPSCIQSPLLLSIQQLINTIKASEFGLSMACFCLSILLLPHVQKWIKRSESGKVNNGRSDTNLRQAVGICTQMVVDIIALDQEDWHNRLLLDICRLAIHCTAQEGDLPRVGTACLRHVAAAASHFTDLQWVILAKSLWDATASTLLSIRLLNSLYVNDSTDENSDIAEIFVDTIEGLPLTERILAQQVFMVDSQKRKLSNGISHEESTGYVELVITIDGEKQSRPPEGLEKILTGDCCGPCSVPSNVRIMMHHCLDASFQVARDFDRRQGLSAVLGRAMGIRRPNLYKQLVSSALIKMHSFFICAMEQNPPDLSRLCDCHCQMVALLRTAEVQISEKRIAAAAREHKEEKFEFMLVECDGEKLYKPVSKADINNAISEYHRQRPMGIPSRSANERPNPFNNVTMEEKDGLEPDYETLCLLAYRQICLVPIQTILALDNAAQLLPQTINSVKSLILATPDLTIRQLAVRIIDLILS
ncbi:hypothetical protein RB195_006380 [Necator americanus]|uniref:SEC7 domain-containing protein n=1 Tax=Necator americanus TaxID=51031 RepID=A0ABR1BW57_NECAM